MEEKGYRLKTLKARLKQGVMPCYYVTGDDYYLFDKAVSMITSAINLQLEDFNKAVFDDDNFSYEAFLNACDMMPMGSDKRLVIIKNITKINENDKKNVENYLNNPCLTTVLIILDFYDKLSFAKNLCEFVDAKRMDRTLSKNIIVADLAKRGKQISGEAVETLLDYCNGYLTNVMNELDKLVYFDTNESLITKKVVENVAIKNEEFAVFELTEALGKKDADKAMKLISRMEKEVGTLSLISNHFRRLFFIAISSDATNASLANLLGVKEYAIAKQRQQLGNFSKMQLKKIYSLLEEVDYMVKSGQMLIGNALYFLAFSILFV